MLRQNKEQPKLYTKFWSYQLQPLKQTFFFGLSCNPLRGEETRDEALRTCSWDAIAASAAEVFIRFSSKADSW